MFSRCSPTLWLRYTHALRPIRTALRNCGAEIDPADCATMLPLVHVNPRGGLLCAAACRLSSLPRLRHQPCVCECVGLCPDSKVPLCYSITNIYIVLVGGGKPRLRKPLAVSPAARRSNKGPADPIVSGLQGT